MSNIIAPDMTINAVHAAYPQYSTERIRNAIEAGRLRAVREAPGCTWFTTREWVEEWIRSWQDSRFVARKGRPPKKPPAASKVPPGARRLRRDYDD